MARYHREFLVPYLQCVCALHLADRKLCERRVLLEQKINALQQEQEDLLPEKPMRKPVFTLGRVLSMLLGLCGLFCVLVGLSLEGIDALIQISFLATSSTLVCIFLGGALYRSIHAFAINQSKLRIYRNKLAEYEERSHADPSFKTAVPALQAQRQRCIAENHRVCSLLNQVYYANIIPRPFRNIHSAIYLYDWFRTSRADDLDMALTMLVHNQNHEKLDRAIDKQSSVILEQCIALADQQYALDQQHYHQQMRAKLNQNDVSTEERSTHLCMLESTAASIGYFATAEYLRSL